MPPIRPPVLPNQPVLSLPTLSDGIANCNRCPRLRDHCESVAVVKRRAYAGDEYWGKPVPGFGDATARLWIVGLAPGAHGANRTGRVFTGDRSGDFLFAALHRAGYANQPTSVHLGDGLKLNDCYISAAVRCAPPGNKPLPIEAETCRPFMLSEWELLSRKCVLLALGKFAWDAVLATVRVQGFKLPKPLPSFGHGAAYALSPSLTLVGSYHVSQQNTFTGKLTTTMFDRVLLECRERSKEFG